MTSEEISELEAALAAGKTVNIGSNPISPIRTDLVFPPGPHTAAEPPARVPVKRAWVAAEKRWINLDRMPRAQFTIVP